MCSKCALDPGTFCGWCPVCGCAMGKVDGEDACMPGSCWCDKQPDVSDWHALRDDSEPLPPIEDKEAWIDRVLDCFDDGSGGTVEDKS